MVRFYRDVCKYPFVLSVKHGEVQFYFFHPNSEQSLCVYGAHEWHIDFVSQFINAVCDVLEDQKQTAYIKLYGYPDGYTVGIFKDCVVVGKNEYQNGYISTDNKYDFDTNLHKSIFQTLSKDTVLDLFKIPIEQLAKNLFALLEYYARNISQYEENWMKFPYKSYQRLERLI